MVDEQAGYALIGAAAWRASGRPAEELSAGGSFPASCAGAPGGLEEGCGCDAAEGQPAPAARRSPAPRGTRRAALLATSACLAGAVAALGWRAFRRARASLAAAGPEWNTALSSVEKVLIVTSPGGQTQCEGTYVIQDHVPANGKPTWKKNGTGVPRTIYFSNTGTWMIDNDDALKVNFDCAIGYIHAPLDKSGDKMPWELDGWERYDNDAAKWIVDPAISVQAIGGGSDATPLWLPGGGAEADEGAPDAAKAVAKDKGSGHKSTTTEAESATTAESSTKASKADSTASEDDKEPDGGGDDEDLEGHGPCNDPGEDCRKSKCCTDDAHACFEKNDFYATCRESCTVGMVEDSDEKEFQTPWSCYTWGRPLPTTTPRPPQEHPSQEPAPCKSPSKTPVASLRKTEQCQRSEVGAQKGEARLLCFAVSRASGDELALVQSQIWECAGLFRCDHWLVFSNDEVCLNPGDSHEVSTLLLPEFEARQGVAGALTATWVNTEAFMAAWGRVIEDANYEDNDWVIKIDPDAVFLPNQLRKHLLDGDVKASTGGCGKGAGCYLRNCPTGDRDLHLFGSLEVISSSALSTYRDAKGRCKDEIDWSLMGEDMWLQQCLELIGVQPVEDYQSLLADGYCPGSSTACTPDKVAFHPFKLPSMWMDCYGKATGSIPQ